MVIGPSSWLFCLWLASPKQRIFSIPKACEDILASKWCKGFEILTIVHNSNGDTFPCVPQLPGFCHVQIKARSAISLPGIDRSPGLVVMPCWCHWGDTGLKSSVLTITKREVWAGVRLKLPVQILGWQLLTISKRPVKEVLLIYF